MSRNTKIALAVVGGLIGVCCLGAVIIMFAAPAVLTSVFGGAISSSPEEAAATAHEIVDYELPPGYQEQSAMNILTTKLAVITNDSNDMALMLMQLPSTITDEEELRRQIQQGWSQQTGQSGTTMELVEEQPITVRDQSTTLTIMEGTDSNGNTIRQAITSFAGENGTVVFMAVGNTGSWDQDAVDQFIESIR